MNVEFSFLVSFVTFFLVLGSLVSGFAFGFPRLAAWRSLIVCLAIICFALYAPMGWLVLASFLISCLEMDDGIGSLLALVLTPGVFIGLSVVVCTVIRRLYSEEGKQG